MPPVTMYNPMMLRTMKAKATGKPVAIAAMMLANMITSISHQSTDILQGVGVLAVLLPGRRPPRGHKRPAGV